MKHRYSLIIESILDSLAHFECDPDEADNILDDVKGDYRTIYERAAETEWLESLQFDAALMRKCAALAREDEARRLK